MTGLDDATMSHSSPSTRRRRLAGIGAVYCRGWQGWGWYFEGWSIGANARFACRVLGRGAVPLVVPLDPAQTADFAELGMG